MLSFNILLMTISPYTAFLPVIIITFKILQSGDILYRNQWNTGLLILFGWSFISGLVNTDPISTAASFVLLFYFFFSIYLQNYYTDEEKIETLLKTVLLFSIGSAIIGILEAITSLFYKNIWWGELFGIPSHMMVDSGYRIYSTFGNPNVAGAWFATMIMISLYFYDKSHGFKKFLYSGCIALFTLVLILTGSRGAALGLLPGIAAYGLLKKQDRSYIMMGLIFSTVFITMFVPHDLFIKLHQLGSSIGYSINNPMSHSVESSVNTRDAIWLACLNMFKLKPLTGWGIMGVYFLDPRLFHFVREPHGHNILLTIAATMGVVGLGAYIYMKFYLFEGIKLLLNRGSKLTPLLAAIQVMVIGHGLVDFTIMTPQGGLIFFGCSALISSLAMQYSKASSNDVYTLPLWVQGKEIQG